MEAGSVDNEDETTRLDSTHIKGPGLAGVDGCCLGKERGQLAVDIAHTHNLQRRRCTHGCKVDQKKKREKSEKKAKKIIKFGENQVFARVSVVIIISGLEREEEEANGE